MQSRRRVARSSGDSRGSQLTTHQTPDFQFTLTSRLCWKGFAAFHTTKRWRQMSFKWTVLQDDQTLETSIQKPQFRTFHSHSVTRCPCVLTVVQHGAVMTGVQTLSRVNTGYGQPQDDWVSLCLTSLLSVSLFSSLHAAGFTSIHLSSQNKLWHCTRSEESRVNLKKNSGSLSVLIVNVEQAWDWFKFKWTRFEEIDEE